MGCRLGYGGERCRLMYRYIVYWGRKKWIVGRILMMMMMMLRMLIMDIYMKTIEAGWEEGGKRGWWGRNGGT